MATLKHNYRRTQLITLAVLSAILFLNSGCGRRGDSGTGSLRGGQLGVVDTSSIGGNSSSTKKRSKRVKDQADSSDDQDNNWSNGSQDELEALPASTIQTAANFGLLNTCYYNVLDQGIKNLRNTRYSVQDVYVGAGTELMKCYEYIITVKQQTYNDAIKKMKDYQVWQANMAQALQYFQQQQAKSNAPVIARPPTVLLKAKPKGKK